MRHLQNKPPLTPIETAPAASTVDKRESPIHFADLYQEPLSPATTSPPSDEDYLSPCETSDASSTCSCCSDGEEEGRLTQEDLARALGEIGPMQEWESNKWKSERTLSTACGRFGRVDLVTRRQLPGDHVSELLKEPRKAAVKVVPLKWLGTSPEEFNHRRPASPEHPWQDIGIMKFLNSKGFSHSIDLLGLFVSGETAYILTSLATQGDLFSWSEHQAAPGPERETAMRPIVKQVMSAVAWLHDVGIAHRDLSLENILLTSGPGSDLQVKIIDFGMASLEPRKCRGVRGKPSYQAPEMHLPAVYDGFSVDSFALGVTLFGMACKRYPWKSTAPGGDSAYNLMKSHGLVTLLSLRSMHSNGKPLAQVLSDTLLVLMQGLLATCPEERPHARQCSFDAFCIVPTEEKARSFSPIDRTRPAALSHCRQCNGDAELVSSSCTGDLANKSHSLEVQSLPSRIPEVSKDLPKKECASVSLSGSARLCKYIRQIWC